MSVVVVRHDQDSIFRNSNMLSVWPDSWRKWKILYCTWYNKNVTFYIWKYMKRCTDYFVSFNNISTSFSHFYMKNGEFVSSGNDYLPLLSVHCLLPCAVKVTWYICLAIKTNVSVAPNLFLYIQVLIKADMPMHLQKTAIF